MKKIISWGLLIAILLTLYGCGAKKEKITFDNTENIIKITIYTLPGNKSSLKSTEDKGQITEIIDYINGLDLKKPTKDADQYVGMSYIITVYFDDKTNIEYIHFGNTFFKELGKEWYEIPYEQAEKFEGIYKSLGNK